MTALKKLAGQTAIYGIPSILGRFLNYLLVFLHTDVLQTNEYGIYNDLYTYVAFLIMIYTFGMETTFFRFANKGKPKEAYKNAGSFVFYLSTFFSLFIIVFAEDIAASLGYVGKSHYVVWLGLILWIDAIVALPFAKLRLENKPLKFAGLRMANICSVILLQFFFLWVCPRIYEGSMLTGLQPLINSFYNPDFGIEYIIIANLIANALYILFLIKSVLAIGFKIDPTYFKKMLWYALPLTITGIAGITNQRLDVILIGDWLPENFYPGKSSQDIQGIYSASVKLSVLMIIGTQAFRFAAEPFFFSKAKDKNAPTLFAKVLRYFFIAGIIVFIGVSINKEFIANILLRNPAYRGALMAVPWLLAGKLMEGVYINFSIWFKITDKTIFGTYFTIVGACITVIGNFILIPKFGYMAPAYISVITYGLMAGLCYYYGQRHFPIPYNLKALLTYAIAGICLVIGAELVAVDDQIMTYIAKIALTIIVVLGIFLIERKRLRANT